MAYFGKFYLDKEKDILIELFIKNRKMSFILRTPNHHTGNLITNLAKVLAMEISYDENDLKIIQGEIPRFIKGDGQIVYVMRLAGTKIANIYPSGKIEINATVPAICKTLMAQTKEYNYDITKTLIKSYILSDVKLRTDIHTHANASLTPDVLIALGIKHQIRYPLYYIKKLQLRLTDKQKSFLEKRRQQTIKTFDNLDLSNKYDNRKVDDNTFINFADLILNNSENSSYNFNRIRNSLSILKDSQAVFTNLEKLYIYRYVFTKGVKADYLVDYRNIEKLNDIDIYTYLVKMLKDKNNHNYQNNTLYQDTLLWTGRSYQLQHVKYVEISDTTLVKNDKTLAEMLQQIHYILPLIEKETGVIIRFLAALRRIPLTIVKDAISEKNYLGENLEVLKISSKDPYVVGCDFVGEEINDISELKEVIREIVQTIAYNDPIFTIRIHAGENDMLKNNMAKALKIVEESLLENQPYPIVRIGHGIYGADFTTKKGKQTLQFIKRHNVILEFQLTSNVRLNNMTSLAKHPLKKYLNYGIHCVQGSDGCGLYGTDSIDEQLALQNLLNLTLDDFNKMKRVEDIVIDRAKHYFKIKTKEFNQTQNIYDYYLEKLASISKSKLGNYQIKKLPSYQLLKNHVVNLPWDKFPIVLAGGSFSGANSTKLFPQDIKLIDLLLQKLDPNFFYFVIGHKVVSYEKYLVQNNPGFDIYSIVPSLITKTNYNRLLNANLKGVRISTESQEMGIYKSFNYEIFERRDSIVLALSGNLAVGNLVQEARNGKGKADIYISKNCRTLKEKSISLKGYVTTICDGEAIANKILSKQYQLGREIKWGCKKIKI
ncbi:MAG: hypothetical protein ACI4WG_00385 [Erysipelotrichaceae bacterium]